MSKKKSSKRPIPIYEGFFDQTNVILLHHASIDATTDHIQATFGATTVHRNVANSPATHKGACVFTAQPVRSEWTMILEEPCHLFTGLLSAEGARQLSDASGRKVLLIVSEDTSGFVGYEMFENGESIEYLESGTGDDQFRSTRGKSLSASQLSNSRFNPIKWIGDMLAELNAVVLPAALAPMTDTECMFISGDEDASGAWERIDFIVVSGSNLPAENYMNVDS